MMVKSKRIAGLTVQIQQVIIFLKIKIAADDAMSHLCKELLDKLIKNNPHLADKIKNLEAF